MEKLKEHLEIEYLKSLTYTEINNLFNQLQTLIDKVDTFSLGKCPLYNRDVFITTRGQMIGDDKWVCMLERSRGWCLGKNNRWYFEKNPSSRTDKFINQTRFDTYHEAMTAYENHLSKGKVHKLTI